MERLGRKTKASPARTGATAYIVNYDYGTVTPVDRSPPKVGTPIKVGPTPSAIAISLDGAVAYIANHSISSVTPVDLATATRGIPIMVGSAPVGIAITPDGTTAYVATESQEVIDYMPSGTVTPINLATGTPGTPIRGGIIKPTAIAITPNGATAYVVGGGHDSGAAHRNTSSQRLYKAMKSLAWTAGGLIRSIV
jgi:DNA-binding beta-propeller fold protein YncE